MRWGVAGLFAALGLCAGVAVEGGCSPSARSDGENDAGFDGSADAGPADASEPARDAAGAADASDYADATDADDADADDADDADAAPIDAGPPYCLSLVPQPRFCDDFDDGNLTDDWTQSAFVPGSVAALDGAAFTSGPASFRVVSPATAVAAANNALLRRTMFAAVSHPKLAFSALLPKVTFTKGTIAIATVDVALDHFFTLYLRDADPATPAAVLEEYVAGAVTRHVLAKLPTANVWTRVTIDLDLAAGKADVSFDAQKALDAAPITALAGSEATIRVGAIIDGPADAFEVRVDDVRLDY